jgi:ribA/ribD-fused uncharacterized protein
MSTDELTKFYKKREKNPLLFGYDDTGNLIELNKEGGIVKTIPLPDYRTPTFEEFDEMERSRMENIALATKEYEDARRKLREVSQDKETPESEIMRINRQVIEADIKLQAVRFPLRFIEVEGGYEIRELDFNQPNEKRKFPYDLCFYKVNPFKLQEQYVRIGKAPVKPLISVAEVNAAKEAIVPVILFAEPETNDYGFLSLKWAVDIEFKNTMYNSVQQAISAEIAKAFNDQDNLQKIMIAETPDEIDYKLSDIPGDSDTNEPKWNDLTKQLIYDINIAKYSQFPELAARLLNTKNSRLGAYVPDDNLIGIGISLDNIQSQNPINWTGQNLLGKALMDIREKIRADRELATQQASMVAPSTVEPVSRPIRRRPKPAVAKQE